MRLYINLVTFGKILINEIFHRNAFILHICEKADPRTRNPVVVCCWSEGTLYVISISIHQRDRLVDSDVNGLDRIGFWSDRIKTIGYPRIRQIFMAESTGLVELLAELVGRFGQSLSTDSAINLGRTVHGTVRSWAYIADIYFYRVATFIIL